ncbi:TonB family protein [Vibrio amylolyticus]|uniref:energy transducer TonB n=1 Tax=Vibrio amylolyticus TaxID=2847292 RepID=UPI00354D0668
MGYKHYLIFGGLSFAIHSLAFSANYKPITVAPMGESHSKSVSIQFVSMPSPTPPEARNPDQAIKKNTAKAKPVTQQKALAREKNLVRKKASPPTKQGVSKPIQEIEKPVEPKVASIKEPETQAPKEQVLKKDTQPLQETTTEELVKTVTAQTNEPAEKKAANQALSTAQSAPKLVTKPTFETRPSAIGYPRSAKRRNIQGNVLVEVWLDEDGEQTNLIIVNSSGHQILDTAALRGISEWEFRQHKTQGQAIAHRVQIPINFKLD